jgi:hypothetical protein
MFVQETKFGIASKTGVPEDRTTTDTMPEIVEMIGVPEETVTGTKPETTVTTGALIASDEKHFLLANPLSGSMSCVMCINIYSLANRHLIYITPGVQQRIVAQDVLSLCRIHSIPSCFCFQVVDMQCEDSNNRRAKKDNQKNPCAAAVFYLFLKKRSEGEAPKIQKGCCVIEQGKET